MDYFNPQEQSWRHTFESLRDRVFGPLVSLLARNGVKPNQVTLAGVVSLLGACIFSPEHAWTATALMALYVLCDGMDGPLARRTGRVHPGGALMDIVADQLGVALLPAAAVHHFGAWGPGMVLFASFYLVFIALVVYANRTGVPLRVFLRLKYVFFLLYLASLHLNRDLVSVPCTLFAVYYFVEIQNVLLRIHRHHEKTGPE